MSESAAFLDFLYGDCEHSMGSIVIVAASRNRLVEICPVGSGDRLVHAARVMQANPGSYFKVALMDADAMRERSRKTGKPVVGNRNEVKTVVAIALDVDAGKNEKYVSRRHATWAVDAMPKLPTLVINSNGKTGGFHVYTKLERPYVITDDADRSRCQSIANGWNQRLKALCAGKLDSTSNLDRLLRVPGVPRGDGGEVVAEGYWPDRLYELEDLVV